MSILAGRLSFVLSSPLTRLLHVWLGWLLLAAAILFSWNNQISRFDPEFRSPFDEHTHFDYWWQIYQNKKIPAVYDRIQHESLSIWQCYGESLKKNPNCTPSATGDLAHENTASNYPPTFYAATAGMAWLIKPFIKTNNLFHLAKLANLAWGLICVVLVAWLALVLGVPLLLAAILVFGVGQTPAFVFAGITLNQEMFVFLVCLAGLIWYSKRTIHATTIRFSLETGILAGLCLSIKPTALLLPVIIVVSELLSYPRPWHERVKRMLGFSAVVLIVYIIFTTGINHWRGINPSDGKMKDFLLQGNAGGRPFITWLEVIWGSFLRSTASLHWRYLVNWDLPFLFLRFNDLILGATAIAVPYLAFLRVSRKTVPPCLKLFIGSIIAFFILPMALAGYLLFSDFPFFFQPRYYTAYILVSTILAIAFLTEMARELMASRKYRKQSRPMQGVNGAT